MPQRPDDAGPYYVSAAVAAAGRVYARRVARHEGEWKVTETFVIKIEPHTNRTQSRECAARLFTSLRRSAARPVARSGRCAFTALAEARSVARSRAFPEGPFACRLSGREGTGARSSPMMVFDT